ncbi:MAG: hypothetical protein ACI4V4_04880 [Eubacterium sp.]
MLNIKSLLDEFVLALRKDSYFDEIKIISAYPYAFRPTELKECIIAVGFSDISLESDRIGESSRYGQVKIFVDIFVPFGNDSKMACEIFTHICEVANCYNVVAISAQRTYANKETASYIMKTEVAFNGEIMFGGGSGE